MLAQPVYQQLSGWGLPVAASKADNPWGPRHDVGRRRGSEDDAAAGFWPVNNPNLVSWYFACPPVVKGCKSVNKKHHQASLRACKGFYRAANRSIKWKQGKKTTLIFSSPRGKTHQKRVTSLPLLWSGDISDSACQARLCNARLDSAFFSLSCTLSSSGVLWDYHCHVDIRWHCMLVCIIWLVLPLYHANLLIAI